MPQLKELIQAEQITASERFVLATLDNHPMLVWSCCFEDLEYLAMLATCPTYHSLPEIKPSDEHHPVSISSRFTVIVPKGAYFGIGTGPEKTNSLIDWGGERTTYTLKTVQTALHNLKAKHKIWSFDLHDKVYYSSLRKKRFIEKRLSQAFEFKWDVPEVYTRDDLRLTHIDYAIKLGHLTRSQRDVLEVIDRHRAFYWSSSQEDLEELARWTTSPLELKPPDKLNIDTDSESTEDTILTTEIRTPRGQKRTSTTYSLKTIKNALTELSNSGQIWAFSLFNTTCYASTKSKKSLNKLLLQLPADQLERANFHEIAEQ